MNRIMAVMLSMTLATSVIAAQDQQATNTATATATTTTKSAPKKTVAKKPAPTISEQLSAMKQAIDEQQQQIKQLSTLVESRDQKIQQLEQRLDHSQTVAAQAQTKADSAVAQTVAERETIGELKDDVADLKTVSNNSVLNNPAALKNAVWTLQEPTQTGGDPQIYNKAMESTLTIRFKGINITPGGFAAAEFVRRSRELGADVTTPFNSLTMPGASQSQLSEFFGSARQTRPTIFVEGRLGHADFSSYLSADFLSAGVTSTATQTNSYTLRLRQAWGQVKFDDGWKILGGQMWSLVTENKAGIAPSDDLGKTNDARPQTIDPGYNVGFSFARQYGLRVTKDFGDKFSVAFSMENAQGTLTTHGNAGNYLLGEAGASNTYNTTSNYTANPAPDLVAKIAWDPGFGHYEVFGLVDRFTDRVFPCVEYLTNPTLCGTAGASAIGAYNASKEGGGFGANARWNLASKHITFGLHGFGGSGIGRYGAGQLSDLSINPDGTVHLIKNLQGLASLEWHGKKLDVYAYTGAEYAGRTYGFDPNLGTAGEYVGYGAPQFASYGCYTETVPGTGNTNTGGFNPGALAHCTADTRALIEGTAGFWYTFYSGSKGRFRFGTQYSYVTRQTWSGADAAGDVGALTPEGLDGMVFTSFRYYLP